MEYIMKKILVASIALAFVLFDVRPSLKRIRIQNTCLEVEELFNLQRSLSTIHQIVHFLHRCSDEENTIPIYPYLYALTTDVKTYPQMVKRIDQILDKFGHVKDTASPTLLMIRRELAATAGSVSRALQNILKNCRSPTAKRTKHGLCSG